MNTHRFEPYERDDGLWAWRLISSNGRIVATDGGQGFRDRTDAERSIVMVSGIIRRMKAQGYDA